MSEICATCATKGGIFRCVGCDKTFCRDDLNAHQKELDQQLDGLTDEINVFQQTANENDTNLKTLLLCQIDTWESKSIKKIIEAANDARQEVEAMTATNNKENTVSIGKIAEQIARKRQSDQYDERDIATWKEKLDELKDMISKPSITIEEEKRTDSPLINNIYVNEHDVFDRSNGYVYIDKEGHLAGHRFSLFGSPGEIRGKRKYYVGRHRLRFEIENLDSNPWWFLGIISNSTSMQSNSHYSSSTHGWAGYNEVYMNGRCSNGLNGYTTDYSKGDIIELTLDCDQRLIRMNNLRSKKSYEMIIDLVHCPFPWMIHLNLFHIQTRIRISP